MHTTVTGWFFVCRREAVRALWILAASRGRKASKEVPHRCSPRDLSFLAGKSIFESYGSTPLCRPAVLCQQLSECGGHGMQAHRSNSLGSAGGGGARIASGTMQHSQQQQQLAQQLLAQQVCLVRQGNTKQRCRRRIPCSPRLTCAAFFLADTSAGPFVCCSLLTSVRMARAARGPGRFAAACRVAGSRSCGAAAAVQPVAAERPVRRGGRRAAAAGAHGQVLVPPTNLKPQFQTQVFGAASICCALVCCMSAHWICARWDPQLPSAPHLLQIDQAALLAVVATASRARPICWRPSAATPTWRACWGNSSSSSSRRLCASPPASCQTLGSGTQISGGANNCALVEDAAKM